MTKFPELPPGYRIVETGQRVVGVSPLATCYTRWGAKRQRCKWVTECESTFYRPEIVRENGRWLVVAMQNTLVADSLAALHDQQKRSP
jgi:hypothetical protein